MTGRITITAAAPAALTAATAEDGSTVSSSYWDESKHPRDPGGPGGGQFVPAGGEGKDAAGKQAQKNKSAQANYLKLDKMKPEDAKKFLAGLNAKDLTDLTAIAYSAKTSDKKVVANRLKVAGEMGKRGLDVKKHGARGGGITEKTKKPAAKTGAKKTSKGPSSKSGTVKASAEPTSTVVITGPNEPVTAASAHGVGSLTSIRSSGFPVRIVAAAVPRQRAVRVVASSSEEAS